MTESARVALLESQVRTLKRMFFGVFGLVVAGSVLGATSLQTVPDVIQAKKFEVVNDEGKVIVQMDSVLHQGSHYGFVTTSDSKGEKLVSLGATVRGGGVLTTYNEKGEEVVELTTSKAPGSRGIVKTMNGKGVNLVTLTSGSMGGMVLTQDGKGGKLVEISATLGGEGAVTTENGKGGKLIQIGAGADGEGKVITQNGKGGRLVLIGALDGAGVIATTNGKGELTSVTPEQ